MQLSKQQAMQIVNRYIGVNGGYLGDFSYRTHREFYPEYCDIDDVEPDTFEGTTRERFIKILLSRTPQDQAKILRGVIARFGGNDGSDPKRLAFRAQMQNWALELEGGSTVVTPIPASTQGGGTPSACRH